MVEPTRKGAVLFICTFISFQHKQILDYDNMGVGWMTHLNAATQIWVSYLASLNSIPHLPLSSSIPILVHSACNEEKRDGVYMLKLKVREIAESKNINQAQLSRIADVPINTIRRIWRDPYYEVRLSTLNKIAIALGVPATALFEDTETPNKKP